MNKRILTILVLLVTVVMGAWAEVITADLGKWSVGSSSNRGFASVKNGIAAVNIEGDRGNTLYLTSNVFFANISQIDFSIRVSLPQKVVLSIEIFSTADCTESLLRYESKLDPSTDYVTLGSMVLKDNKNFYKGSIFINPTRSAYIRISATKDCTSITTPIVDIQNVKITCDAAISSYTCQFGETGFATLGLPFATTIPSGCSAYYVKATDTPGTVRIEDIEAQTVAAGTGMIVVGTPNTSVTFDAAQGEATSIDVNLLVANLAGTKTGDASGSYYLLSKLSDSEVGFKLNGATASLRQFGAYLQLPAATGGPQPAVLRIESDASGIFAVACDDAAEPSAYDMMGRPQPAQCQGLNIVNGQIIFVK